MFLIIHPTTKDRAYAYTEAGRDTAKRWLRREATQQGVSPRVECVVVRMKLAEPD